jgi:hypothetical protein
MIKNLASDIGDILMKTMAKHRMALLVCCCLTMGGCFTHTHQSSQIPALQVGSPLKGIFPRKFVLKEFNDARGVDPYLVSFYGYGHKMRMDEPVANVVASAIKNELSRNGHYCVSDNAQQDIDYVIQGSVYKYLSFPLILNTQKQRRVPAETS